MLAYPNEKQPVTNAVLQESLSGVRIAKLFDSPRQIHRLTYCQQTVLIMAQESANGRWVPCLVRKSDLIDSTALAEIT